MTPAQVTAFVLAGGEGQRLRPLTQHLPKPALPFADHCRVIDFTLSNLERSRVRPVYVLLQYKPMALMRHLQRHWPRARPLLPPRCLAGTADAVAQALRSVDIARADVVAVLAADQVYRLDLRQMVEFHLRHGSGVTVAAVAVDVAEASRFGVLGVDGDSRITSFEEKPENPFTLPHDPGHALASMGHYLFQPSLLAELLAAGEGIGTLDFGHDVIPAAVALGRAWAYDFRCNTVPGRLPGEDPAYWCDVGTPAAYAQAQQDARGPSPRIVLDRPGWPIAATLAGEAADQAPGTLSSYSQGSALAGP